MKIIGISSYTDEKKEECIAAGMDALIAKPIFKNDSLADESGQVIFSMLKRFEKVRYRTNITV